MGQFLNSIKETLAEIKDKEDNEFRGQPNIIHFWKLEERLRLKTGLKKFKGVMNDKRASIDKQVSQLKLLSDGAANAWIKDKLKAMKYEEKKMNGELTYEWFEELLKRMKDQFNNLNPWTGELMTKHNSQQSGSKGDWSMMPFEMFKIPYRYIVHTT